MRRPWIGGGGQGSWALTVDGGRWTDEGACSQLSRACRGLSIRRVVKLLGSKLNGLAKKLGRKLGTGFTGCWVLGAECWGCGARCCRCQGCRRSLRPGGLVGLSIAGTPRPDRQSTKAPAVPLLMPACTSADLALNCLATAYFCRKCPAIDTDAVQSGSHCFRAVLLATSSLTLHLHPSPSISSAPFSQARLVSLPLSVQPEK